MEQNKTIKVLIADDERIVRQGLRSTIPWDKYGMEVVADEPNGRKAWEAFAVHRPEVVITDIVMPEMDGIELSRKIKSEAPGTKILLLSCHRDFEYAQQGMKLGASGYLLKTAFEDEELEEMLERFRSELSAVPSVQEADGEDRFGTLLHAWLNGLNDKLGEEMERRVREELSGLGGPAYLYLIKFDGCDESLRDRLRSELAADRRSVDGAIHEYGEQRCYYLTPERRADAVDGLLVELKSRCAKLKWSRRGPLTGIDDTLEAWKALHKEAELEKIYGVSPGDWPEPIWRAVKLLHEHPAADWSVSDVAGQVGLSRSHFSILFKKAVGDSFVAFQYKRKLRLAFGLLKDTQLTLQEIAERTGLGDSKYFSKWFKRCTGTTPSQYRMQQKEESARTE